MNRRPNRIVLLLAGLVLATVGATALLAAARLVALPEPAALSAESSASFEAYPQAWAAGAVLGGLLAAAVGAWLVKRQFKTRPAGRVGRVTLARGDRGRTTLEAAAVARAAAADLRSRRGVVASHVRMVTFGARPRLLVSLAIDADTEPRTALERAEEVYGRVCRLIGRQTVRVDTVVRPTAAESSRVR